MVEVAIRSAKNAAPSMRQPLRDLARRARIASNASATA